MKKNKIIGASVGLAIGLVLGTVVLTNVYEKIDYSKASTTIKTNANTVNKAKRNTWELLSKRSNSICTESVVTIYEDDDYEYTVPNQCYINETYIGYKNGLRVNIKKALDKKIVTIKELIAKGAKIKKNPKIKIYEEDDNTWELVRKSVSSVCMQVVTTLYEDDDYTYQVPNSCYANEYYVEFKDGTYYTIKKALTKKIVTVDELIAKGADITKSPKIKILEPENTWKIVRKKTTSVCMAAITTIYEDDDYIYEAPDSCYAHEYYVVFTNGKSYTIKNALSKKILTADELIAKGASITKSPKIKIIEPIITWKLVRRDYSSVCMAALSPIYEDSNYVYQAPSSCYADQYYVVYSDGREYTLRSAINRNFITVDEAIEKGADITKCPKVKENNWSLARREGYLVCLDAMDEVYKDNYFVYLVPNSCYAEEYRVIYTNGEDYSIKEALNKKLVTVDELIEKGADITKVGRITE